MRSNGRDLGPRCVIAAAILASAHAHAQPVNETDTLLAPDGAAGARFGAAVAIDALSVVGASGDAENGTNAGAAYLYDSALFDQKLLPDDGAAFDQFGFSVAVDGDLVVVGAPGRAGLTGAAYVFDRSTGLQTTLVADDAEGFDQLGYAVSIDGDLVVVGAIQDDDRGSNAGAVYLFDARTGQQIRKLLADDGSAGDQLGSSVAISGSLVLVGAVTDADSGPNSGSAYVFDAATGQQLHKLSPDDAGAFEFFGNSVSLAGDLALVGAFLDGENGAEAGAAYIFDALTGEQLRKLLPADADAGDRFGHSVSISGTHALVGAINQGGSPGAGAAYLFDAVTGAELAQLSASAGAAGDALGFAVAVRAGRVIVGAPAETTQGADAGAAYLFDADTLAAVPLDPPSGRTGAQFGIDVALDADLALIGSSTDDTDEPAAGSAYLVNLATAQSIKLAPDDGGSSGDAFGQAVDLDASTAIVGAAGDDQTASDAGAAYLFDADTGTQLFKLLAPDGAANDSFGSSVSISGSRALVGARFDADNGDFSGSAYVFDAATGAFVVKLLPNDGAPSDRFGAAVAVSGNVAIVGAEGDDDNGSASGAAYLFDATTGQQLFKLLPDDGGPNQAFGTSVAISGNLALVGAPFDDDNDAGAGAAYVFSVSTGQQLFKLLAPDGAEQDALGIAVALSGNLALVGAPFDDDGAADSGSAYLFDADTGAFVAKLDAEDPDALDDFGGSVAIDGTTVLIGAIGDDDHADLDAGAAYVFDASTQQVTDKLLAFDGIASDRFATSLALDDATAVVGSPDDDDNGADSGSAHAFPASGGSPSAVFSPADISPGDAFASSLSVSNGRVLAGSHGADPAGGSSGSAYLFDADTGAQLREFSPLDAGPGDQFGIAVALDGTRAVVGADRDDDRGSDAGAAYVFDADTGAQLLKLLASDGAADDFFGRVIAADAGTVLVGSLGDDDNGGFSGSAYLFDAETGAQLFKLLPPDGAPRDQFGRAVAISQGRVLVGSRFDDHSGADSGSAYIFDAATGQLLVKILAPEGAASDQFGVAVAISGTHALVGASESDRTALDAGAAWLYTLPGVSCPADIDDNGVLNVDDVAAFIAAFTNADPAADLNDDGSINIDDVQAFIDSFVAGCP